MDGPDRAVKVAHLLVHPNLVLSADARADLEAGVVDPRLVAVLLALARKHRIEVSLIKAGHPFGPVTPGGKTNAHYYGRVADIVAVDRKPIAGNGADPGIVDVGRILRGMRPEDRPDQIMGPQAWHEALGYPRSAGFLSGPFHDAIHRDHLHVGFASESGTGNEE